MDEKHNELDDLLKSYEGTKGALIPILQKTQRIFGYLPHDIMKYIADKLNMSSSEIYGVATFYTQFRFSPVGGFVIKVCHGTACHVGGSNILLSMLESKLKIKAGETTKDGLFTILTVSCLGCCSLAPVVMINEKTYGNLTNEKLTKIIDEYQKEGKCL